MLKINIEADPIGNGPWIQFVALKDCSATAWLKYE
jgi:hypothetical protein